MSLNRIQKLLFSEYSDFEDMVLVESPFAETTREGRGIRQVQIGEFCSEICKMQSTTDNTKRQGERLRLLLINTITWKANRGLSSEIGTDTKTFLEGNIGVLLRKEPFRTFGFFDTDFRLITFEPRKKLLLN